MKGKERISISIYTDRDLHIKFVIRLMDFQVLLVDRIIQFHVLHCYFYRMSVKF